MGLFVPRLLKEILEKEKELPKKIVSVCDYYDLSNKLTNFDIISFPIGFKHETFFIVNF